jgi:hypothetical protein
MRPAVAVRLDIRPRLRLSPEPPAAPLRRGRLPAFALPATAYWLAMAGLTYAFAQLGPRPLERAWSMQKETEPPAAARPAPALATEPEPMAEPEPPVTPPTPSAIAEVSAATPPETPEREPEPEPEPARPASSPRGPASEPQRLARLERPAETAPPPTELPSDPPLSSLPDFTDSSRRAPREHAADGPRLTDLFEPSRAAPPTAAGDEPARDTTAPEARRSLTSCEAAIARNNEQLEIGAARGPADVTREAYANILQNGEYLRACRLPERTVIEICAAVKQGRAVGVTVVSNPPSAALEACVRGRVARLTFPHSERLDVTHTRFDAAR